jgi:GNAT superfamily N-acetyltransferase
VLTDFGLDVRRDVNKSHFIAFANATGGAFQQYFAKYAENQIHLWLLVTHPDFRRRGVGTMLTDWGINAAREKSWPVTIFASPMGELLYAHLGFKNLAYEVARADEEEEKYVFAVMELTPDEPKEGL